MLNAKFRATKFRDGYDQDEVDDFLDRVVEALRARDAGQVPALSVADLERVRFTSVKFREGYEPSDVDELIDRVRADLGGAAGAAPAQAGSSAAFGVTPPPLPNGPADATDGQIPGMVPQRRGLFGRKR